MNSTYPDYPGAILAVQGPSGAGKGTIVRKIRDLHPQLQVSISCTTRAPRPGEIDGEHCHFLTRAEFAALMADGSLIEWAEYSGEFYGTLRADLDASLEAGALLIKEFEISGFKRLFEHYGPRNITWIQVVACPLRPMTKADEAVYRGRIIGRSPELADSTELEQRIETARAEELPQMIRLHDPWSAYTVVNDEDDESKDDKSEPNKAVKMVDAEVVTPLLERLGLI